MAAGLEGDSAAVTGGNVLYTRPVKRKADHVVCRASGQRSVSGMRLALLGNRSRPVIYLNAKGLLGVALA